MARLIQAFREEPHPCPYLADQEASLDVRLLVDVTAGELGLLLEHGWRRFGPTYFRPACAACNACVAVRIPVAGFRPSRSQRRALRQAASLVRAVEVPLVDDERLALHARWHTHRESRRGWEPRTLDAERYTFDLAFDHPAVREVSFRDPSQGNRLVGLGIVDAVPHALSAAYFFWDPDEAPPSLGTAHVLGLIQQAADAGLDHVYLGYRVDGCPSLAYKGRFAPQEALQVRRPDASGPEWRLHARRDEASGRPDP
jgi:arginine-tRNA-protein transferase